LFTAICRSSTKLKISLNPNLLSIQALSELPKITGNFCEKKPVMVVKKMAGTPVPPVSVFTGASTLNGPMIAKPDYNIAYVSETANMTSCRGLHKTVFYKL
jgi:hypothetical protein